MILYSWGNMAHCTSFYFYLFFILIPWVTCITEADLFSYGNGANGDESDAFVTDGTAFLQLDIPIVLYGVKHNTAHVSLKGIVTFGAEPAPALENRPFPLSYAAIAPFYADILAESEADDSGFVQFRQSKKPELLDKANNQIHQLFPDQSSFQAKALLIATWSDVLGYGLPTNWNNTFQLVVANDGEDSFAFFLYPRIVWAQTRARAPGESDLSAQAGFFAADGRKTLLEGSGTDYLRALPNNKLPEEGAIEAGTYVYRIGQPLAATETEGHHEAETAGHEQDYSHYEEADGERARTREPIDDRHPLDPANLRTPAPQPHTDVDVPNPEDHQVTGHEEHLDPPPTAEAPSGYSYIPPPAPTPRDSRLQGDSVCTDAAACHANAQCRSFTSGSCCECQEGFVGNGKLCIDKETPQRMNGQASGQLNGAEFRDALMHNYVIINEGRVYVAYSPITSEVGHALQTILPMATIVGWMFALPENGVANGLTLTGGVFNHSATVKFTGSGQTVHVSQHFSGLDEHNMLHSTLYVTGTTPPANPGQTFEFADHNIEYRRVSPGLIQSYSSHAVQIGEESHRYTVEESISYFECPHNEQLSGSRTTRLQVQGVVSLYQLQEKASRFGMNAKMTLYGQAGQDVCQNTNCGQFAGCVPQGEQAQCVCQAGYQIAPGSDPAAQPISCVDIDECTSRNECSPNAECTNTDGSFRCQCQTGYTGDGRNCRTIGETEQPDACGNCDPNADCTLDQYSNRQVCRCRSGYEGDGYRCALAQSAGDCAAQPELCDRNARCQANQQGQMQCVCSTGYVGDGRTCQQQQGNGRLPPGEDSCYHHPEQCDKNAACIPVKNGASFQCNCLSGYEGDGRTCRALVVTRGGFLVFTQGMSIMKLPVDRSSADRGGQVAILPGQTAVGIAVDCADSNIYWSDIAGHTINKARYDGTGTEAVLRNIMSAEGIAVDSISRNIFWTDSAGDHIAVAKLTDVKAGYKIVIGKNLSNPRAIALHPARGAIFWTDWNRDSPKIETANMDGSDRRVLINSGLGLPNALTVDLNTDDVCWADAGNQKVECASVDGSNRRMVFFGASYPFSMTAYQDTLYWTDWANNNVISVRKGGSEKHIHDLPIGSSGKVYGIASVPEECPRLTNGCAGDNGGCRFICLPLQNGQRKCACPENLSEDQCAEDPVYRN
ncbi:nidogen-like [Paramacrobiotus metropolitanus]|uniref:nidogen-like n=1 Tax=Paramacrobiotus metropolitanus TaxID=2943436 RepID=UPI0024457442|nr:nidogen-like [Paramacrobiotus metropolitanus]